jgi:hypothetical protein
MAVWQQHIQCANIIRAHPDWTDEQVLEAARMHELEINIVQEARREVEGEATPSATSHEQSFDPYS